MKTNIFCVIFLFCLVACSNGNTVPDSASTLQIESVQVGQVGTDAGAQFSTIITFVDNGLTTAESWQLGFYMPRTFDTVVTAYQNINPDLTMQICDLSSNCSDLIYTVAESFTANDLSHGYTTILTPESSCILQSGQTYVVSLLHNNQWSAGNYSAVPQNFFLVNQGIVYNLSTTTATYNIIGYNQSTVNTQISTHVSTNWTNSISGDAPVNIIPTPVSYTPSSGNYTLTNGVVIHTSAGASLVATQMKSYLLNDLGINATIDNNTSATTGILISFAGSYGEESYAITINSSQIMINASHVAGAFYALQSLRQLWNQSTTIAGANIVDYPRFKYRGILLDVARHDYTVAQIEQLIDLMATHKLNTLHIHFADDEGFRIGLTDYPTLSSIGDVRGYGQDIGPEMFLQANLDGANLTGLGYPPYVYANSVYSGTYSASDIETLVAYANLNQITIIPEIDLPGHSRALIKALPSIMVDPNDTSIYISVQGYTDDVLPVCTYNGAGAFASTFTSTINDIVNKVALLFNNQTTAYAINNEVSVGGDEVSSGAWTVDSSCTGIWDFVATGISPSSLQKSQYFFQLLAQNNTNLVFSGWQQMVQTESSPLGANIVPATQTGHVWVWGVSSSTGGIAGAITLAQASYPTVLAYADNTYFDLTYTPNISEPGFTWATSYSDTQAALTSAVTASTTITGAGGAYESNIVGIEGALWGENMPTGYHMIYMALPKMAGLSEASWSPATATVSGSNVNWQSLVSRLGCGSVGFLKYLNTIFGVEYRGYPNGIALEVPSSVCGGPY